MTLSKLKFLLKPVQANLALRVRFFVVFVQLARRLSGTPAAMELLCVVFKTGFISLITDFTASGKTAIKIISAFCARILLSVVQFILNGGF